MPITKQAPEYKVNGAKAYPDEVLRPSKTRHARHTIRSRRNERAVDAYHRWLEVRNFSKVGDILGVGRQSARELVRKGWRIESIIHPDAEYPGQKSNERKMIERARAPVATHVTPPDRER